MTVYAAINFDDETTGIAPTNVTKRADGNDLIVAVFESDGVGVQPAFAKMVEGDLEGGADEDYCGGTAALDSVPGGIIRYELLCRRKGGAHNNFQVHGGHCNANPAAANDFTDSIRWIVYGAATMSTLDAYYELEAGAVKFIDADTFSFAYASTDWMMHQTEWNQGTGAFKHRIKIFGTANVTDWETGTVPEAWDDADINYLYFLGLDGTNGDTFQVAQIWVADDSEAFPDGVKVGPTTVVPTLGTIEITGYDPTIAAGVNVESTLGTLEIAGYDPAIAAGIKVEATLGTLEITGYNPVVKLGHVVVIPTLGSLVIHGNNPTVTATSTPPTGGTITVAVSEFIRMATKASMLSLFKDGEELTGGRKWRTFVEGVVTKDELDQFVTSASAKATSINTDTTNFDGILSTADTTVQKALDKIDDSGLGDHGTLTGLDDDDHAQYLNTTRHLGISGGNPHAVTHLEVGSTSALWNANKIQGTNVETATPTAGDVMMVQTTGGLPEWYSDDQSGLDHGSLSGLDPDDDHTQYAKTDGSRAITGAQTFNAGILTDTISEKTGATGVTIDSVVLKDNTVTATSASIGDGTNDVDISAVGVYLTGTSTMWEDLRVPALSVRVPAAGDPDFALFKNDGEGAPSQGVFLYWFDPASEEEVYFTAQIPHAWAEGTDIKAHVHWVSADTAGGAGTDVCWGLEYTWSDINEVFGNTTLIYGDEQSNGAGETLTVDKHYITEIGTITGTGHTLSSMLVCRLFRDATGVGGTDDYDDDAGLMEFDFHYQINSFGSKEEYVKGP